MEYEVRNKDDIGFGIDSVVMITEDEDLDNLQLCNRANRNCLNT